MSGPVSGYANDERPTTNDRRLTMPNEKPSKPSLLVQAGRLSQIAFVLPAATVLGWLLGSALDRWLHTSWIQIVGLLLGIAAGMVDLIRTALANSK